MTAVYSLGDEDDLHTPKLVVVVGGLMTRDGWLKEEQALALLMDVGDGSGRIFNIPLERRGPTGYRQGIYVPRDRPLFAELYRTFKESVPPGKIILRGFSLAGIKYEAEGMWESDVDLNAGPDGISLEVDYLEDEAGLFVPLKNSGKGPHGAVSMIGGMWIGGL
jgi:hypothetical protein